MGNNKIKFGVVIGLIAGLIAGLITIFESDTIKWVSEFITLPPSETTSPSLIRPADEAIVTADTTKLQWTVSTWNNRTNSTPINYNVYFGTSTPLSQVRTVPAGTTDFDLPATQPNTTYYWKVEAIDGSSDPLSTSKIWSFTTEGNSDLPSDKKMLGMVYVAGGSFEMGCTSEQSGSENDEKPVHTVTLSDYYIGKYEVTHTEYIAFLNAYGVSSTGSYGGKEYIDMDNDDCAIGHRDSSFYFEGSSIASTENTPVIEVTWYGAEAYCEWAGGRLPTEAEWEYAARGGNQSGSYEYAGSNTLGDVAWYRDNSYSLGTGHPDYGTHSVGEKQANELGIYDMSGNVWEWCSAWYGSYSSSAVTNPTGPARGSHRVLRGGSWHYGTSYCRVAYRSRFYPDFSLASYGFRLASSSD